MSDKSLFSKHIAILTKPESNWTADQKAEWNKINALELPPLRLPQAPEKTSFWKQWQIALSGLALASLVFFVSLPLMRKPDDILTAKGTVQVSVYWERAGKINPFNETSVLQDGDKIGAKVISSVDAVAYWTIADQDFKTLDEAKEIENSRISLSAGMPQSFNSSFQLVSPNQGENLIVIICPKPLSQDTKTDTALILDRKFINDVLEKQNIKVNDCMYVGFHLRKAP